MQDFNRRRGHTRSGPSSGTGFGHPGRADNSFSDTVLVFLPVQALEMLCVSHPHQRTDITLQAEEEQWRTHDLTL